MGSKKIDKLLHEIDEIEKSVYRFSDAINDNTTSKDELKIRYQRIKNYDKKYKNLILKLKSRKFNYDDNRSIEFEQLFFRCLSLATQMISTGNNSEQILLRASDLDRNSSQNNSYDNVNVRLPKISLPQFDGKFEDWQSFYDSFNAMVIENSRLRSVEKFNYLKASIKGDAAKVISSISITENSFETAWNLLLERFDNKAILIQQHLNAIFDLESLKREDYTLLRKLIDDAMKHIKALELLSVPIESWDTILIFILKKKLDNSTKRQWGMENQETVLPTLVTFRKFIINRCNVLEDLYKQIPKQHEKEENVRGKAKVYMSRTVVNDFKKQSCKLCNSHHLLYQCDKFLKMSIKDRISCVKENRFCFNCLKPSHFSSDCSSSGCRICNNKHNTLLHLKRPSDTLNNDAPTSKKQKVYVNDNENRPGNDSL